MAEAVHNLRCVHCRSEIAVPDSYQHGDHVKCGSCGMRHKVVRGEGTPRLVIADVGPLRDALQANKSLVDRLEAELRHARGSFGVGINGLGVALAYALWQIMRNDHAIDTGLAWEAAGVAIVSGLALEAANFFFLAKRQRMRRLSDEIDEARTESRSLEQKIREASRV
jgi:DNA-directed RNA polymerase subunit RPC12/RpoP